MGSKRIVRNTRTGQTGEVVSDRGTLLAVAVEINGRLTGRIWPTDQVEEINPKD